MRILVLILAVLPRPGALWRFGFILYPSPELACRSGPLPFLLVLGAGCKLELEVIQTHLTQKPVLRGEVGARALRVRSVPREKAC